MTSPSDAVPARAGARPVTALPVDVRGGAHVNLMGAGTVTFVLHAPFKPYVSLVGDFNDWDARAHRMVTDGSGTWWITIAHPGPTRYGFYVAIDDQTHAWVGDPYATEVRWEGDEAHAYLPAPDGAFVWTDQDWRTPSMRDLVIYELCVRDFGGAWRDDRPHFGTFADLIERLDYLADLGVNAVELMPIQAFPGESSWGYNPVFYFAPAQVYGSPADFKRLVDACHRHGLAVILDVAFNHAWGEHPYYRIYPPMFGEHGEWLTDWNPYFHHTPPDVNMWGGVDWDHFTPITTRYFQDVLRSWLLSYHVDGFRFDWVCGVDFDSNDPMCVGFNPYHGISALAWAARQVKPDCLLCGEFWPLPSTNAAKTAPSLVAATELDACWNGHFHHTMEQVLNQRWEWEKQDIFRAIGGYRDDGYRLATQVVNYTASHDEVRPEHEIKYYSWQNMQRPAGMSVPELALRKAKIGLVTLFAAPGVPLIYAGQEFGEDAPRTIDFCPINWNRLDRLSHHRHLELTQRLIAARRRSRALRGDHILFADNDFARDKVVRWQRADPEGETALAAVNFGDAAQQVELEIPYEGDWHDVVADKVQHLAAGPATFALEPWQATLLISV